MKKTFIILAIYFELFLTFSCNKSEYLNAKPDQALVLPESLEDFKAVLDNAYFLNGEGSLGINPVFGEAGADNYYIINGGFNLGSGPSFKSLYTWNDDIHSVKYYEWDYPYRAIFYSNVVLDGLAKMEISPADKSTFDFLRGSALFFRAEMFFGLAQVFAPPYEKTTAAQDPGIVLKIKSDINEEIGRSTVAQTYERIIADLKEAEQLLPITPPGDLKTRPSKSAALALLARTYLSMRDYENAWKYADACLQLYNSLIDYNDVMYVNSSATSSVGIKIKFSPEVIFHSILDWKNISTMFSTVRARVDSNLYNSYNVNDLRKTVFFRNQAGNAKSFKGSYDASSTHFGGIATDEVYLIRAECYARNGDKDNAINDLNTLMEKRWKSGFWTPFFANDATDALNQILTERRKELIFRGLRWTDLRRLNIEGANITLTRFVDGQIYTLAPNSLHYTFLIPPDVINFNPQMQQNAR